MAGKARGLLIDITPLRVSAPFRRIFVARLISLIAIGMLLVSVPVQMYDLTGSSVQVGAATAVTGVATFVGMLLGGVLADRFDRKLLILVGRSAAALSFAGLAANAFGAFGSSAAVPVLYVLALVDGLIGALSTSALMAAVPTLIPRRHLAAVGAIGALTVRIGSAVSPGIAGFVIGAAGVEWAYTVAAVLAFITVIVISGLPSLPPHAAVLDDEIPDDAIPDGSAAPEPSLSEPGSSADAPPVPVPSLQAFLRSQRVVGAVMVVGVIAMFAPGIVALLPALVAQRFDANPSVTGLLFAAVATGAMVAALTSGWLAAVARPGRLLLGSLVATFALMALFGLASYAWLAIILLVVIGFLEAIQEVLRYTLIQHHTPGPLLGRVNGIWMAQEVCGVTVGALVAGAFGSLWVASTAVVYYSLMLLAAAVVAALVLGSLRAVRAEAPARTPVG
ncbi:MFS transporter [Gordonia sp. NB41Y]|uniref:MFS transporter n=1 Tax=Gordonia sp. NB41Y TaxID=875808 RepID=UPI0006B1669A|nr:MFS transporter [Gordonia sp. NB41Y]KOY49769.1 siderophore export protein [Gordonia sp. NB41Y]WLP90910.1 MFS transporter [Gordonia sp. NB41Y]